MNKEKKWPLLVLVFLSYSLPSFAQTFTNASNLLNPNTGPQSVPGASAIDFNSDGLVDIYRPGMLYLNLGAAGFKDILFEAKVIEGASVFGAAFGDYDADGYLDVIFEDLGAPSRVYRNNKNLTFSQINEQTNLAVKNLAQTAGWADYNLDGKLDLYVNNDAGENQLFENLGNGQFSDVSVTAGVEKLGNSYGMAWGDFDNDGDPDIFNATCSFDPARSVKHLFRNNGDGTFSNINVQAGVADSLASWSTNWFDYNNDGYLDLFIGNLEHLPRSGLNRLYRNNGDGTFTNVAIEARVAGSSFESSYGSSIADFDNDGWQDIYVANSGTTHRLHRNNGDGTFSEIAQAAGLQENVHFNVTVGDFNDDGWIDIFTGGSDNNLWYNNGGSNHWLRIKTRGSDENYHGVGARIEVITGNLCQIREIRAGDGFCSQNLDLSAHFGLAGNAVADSVIIKWPGGDVQHLTNVNADQEITVVHGVGIDAPPKTFKLLEPANGIILGSPSSPVRFHWDAAEDSDDGTLNYRLLLVGPDATTELDVGGQTETLVDAAFFGANQICSWTVNVTDDHSVVASSDVFYFSDAACSEIQFFSKPEDRNLEISSLSARGASWADFDGDGFQDLLVTVSAANRLFRNEEGGRFRLATAGDLAFDNASWRSSTWADYDSDGDDDVFITNVTGADRLFKNEQGAFQSVLTSGLSSDQSATTAASWLDYDNDGSVDLFLATLDDTPNRLYHNNGDGTFEQISEGQIVTQASSAVSIACADADNDGDTDIYLVNVSEKNILYQNNGDGTFSEVTDGEISQAFTASSTASWGDFDNDGDQDLFVGRDLGHQNLLFRNEGALEFNLLEQGDLSTTPDAAQSSGWADFDNDGLLDLFVGYEGYSLLYKNEGSSGFKALFGDRTRSLGADACAWADFDRDGDMDLVSVGSVPSFFANTGSGNNWVVVTCTGTLSNISAIGAKVRVRAQIGGNPVWQMREISGQTGHYSQSSRDAHFGLADATRLDSLIVEWPSGHVDRYGDLAVNKYIGVVENQQITSVEVPGQLPDEFVLHQNFPNPFNPDTNITYFLPKSTQVRIVIFNSLGQQVRILLNEQQQVGAYKLSWDGRNDSGVALSSGLYFYRLETDVKSEVRQMILLR